MATFTGTNPISGAGAAISGGVAGNLKAVTASYTITAALASGDIILGPTVPKGAMLLDVILDVSDLDTGGSPAITINVGTSGTAAAFIAATTIGQTGGRARAAVVSSVPATMTADTVIRATVGTGPATGATSGTVALTAYFVSDRG